MTTSHSASSSTGASLLLKLQATDRAKLMLIALEADLGLQQPGQPDASAHARDRGASRRASTGIGQTDPPGLMKLFGLVLGCGSGSRGRQQSELGHEGGHIRVGVPGLDLATLDLDVIAPLQRDKCTGRCTPRSRLQCSGTAVLCPNSVTSTPLASSSATPPGFHWLLEAAVPELRSVNPFWQ
jgi:hypothetical protein